jgi:hypothetical protein
MKIKVGDKVKTGYHPNERDVIRTVLSAQEDNQYGSGYAVSADGGEPCKECGCTKGHKIRPIDGDWFELVK